MPNTDPPLDTPQAIREVHHIAKRVGHCKVYPVACLSRDRQGRALVDFEALVEAGAIAFSDDGDGLSDSALMARAFEELAGLDKIVIQHCENPQFPRGVLHAGSVACELGLPGMDPLAEELMIARDLTLSEVYHAKCHIAHISTGYAIELVRRAKTQGLRATTAVCPHHLLLTDEDCRSQDPNFKMHPPLRPREDVNACIAGVVDGTIDYLVTDHAPHTPQEKARGFLKAPAGVIGLETSLALFARALLEPGHVDWPRLIAMMSTAPAKAFGLESGTLSVGRPADVTIIDPEAKWTIDVARFYSKSRNCPFQGMAVKGRAMYTIVEGVVKYEEGRLIN